MKKIFFSAFIGLLPPFLMAQDVAFNNKTATPATVSITSANNPANAAKVSRRAARENKQLDRTSKIFNRDFKNVADVQWTAGKTDFVGAFTKDGLRNMVWYTKGGNLIYSMRSYGANQLPTAERRLIEDEYGDYKITLVDEVHENDIVVYVVHLENDHNIKLVTLCNGETNIYRAFKKQ